MAAGLFGKLPAKRDFVESGVPPSFMAVWDPWLQGAVALSRNQLGPGWLDLYLAAPIWRFWLGPGIAGQAVLGALMPSVDGVGRYFPLTLVVCGDIAPPTVDGHETWFAPAEALLLSALADGADYADLLAGITALPIPHPLTGAPAAFAALGAQGSVEAHSFWWVPGQAARICAGLPNPADYAMMIGERGELAPGPGGSDDV